MNEYLIYLLIGFACIALGYFLGVYIQSLKTKSSQSALEEREQQLHANLSSMEQRLREAEEHRLNLQGEKEQLGNLRCVTRYPSSL